MKFPICSLNKTLTFLCLIKKEKKLEENNIGIVTSTCLRASCKNRNTVKLYLMFLIFYLNAPSAKERRKINKVLKLLFSMHRKHYVDWVTKKKKTMESQTYLQQINEWKNKWRKNKYIDRASFFYIFNAEETKTKTKSTAHNFSVWV